ncbi:MAG: type II secretion system protein, partial [Planctomycetes bacterium]|nr:type II secretion system protein [Planctomycetota bacterium]
MVKSRVGSRFGSSCSGFSLLETLLTMSLIGAGALAALKLSISNVALETGNEKQAAANAVLQRVIEHIENESFDKIFAIFNYLPDDDPEGP